MDITLHQGETLEITVVADNDTALTVRLVAVDADGNIVIDEIESFSQVDGKIVATIKTNDTNLPVGEYEYMLTLTYEGDVIVKLPDSSDCDEDCELPVIKICKALDVDESD